LACPGRITAEDLVKAAVLSSLADETPEGKSIIELAQQSNMRISMNAPNGAEFIKFTAETRSSGINTADGLRIRKGAFDSIRNLLVNAGNKISADVEERVKIIASNGGTPLVVSQNEVVLGTIELQDIIKPGIAERFERLRKMGIKTVMVTGDNPLTAKFIAEKAGVDDFIAEAKPEDKMNYIKHEQAERSSGSHDGRRNKRCACPCPGRCWCGHEQRYTSCQRSR
jgi:K+-transporting ATPase ATPase B chain